MRAADGVRDRPRTGIGFRACSRRSGPIVSLFERLVGPFPYEKLAHVESSTRFGGMENASDIFYDGALFAQQKVTDGLIAHETAHQWFGDAVTEREWAHLWLSRASPPTSPRCGRSSSRGDAAFKKEMDEDPRQVMASKVVATRPVIDTEQRELHAAAQCEQLPEGRLRAVHAAPAAWGQRVLQGAQVVLQDVSPWQRVSDDLQSEFETASGQSLKQFFDHGCVSPGWPTPTIGWAHDPATGSVTLLVLQDESRIPYELSITLLVNDQPVTVKLPAERRASIVLPGSM